MVNRFQRYGQMVDVLVKYGFGILVEEYIPGYGRLRRLRKPRVEERSVYERIRLAIEELGPTYIKFGQIMSTRRDMVPPGLIEELKKLQDQVDPLPFEQVKPVIQEFCPNLEDCFDLIEEEPFAAASLSQVHRAILKDGSLVALKVQRPGIVDLIETDLLILHSLADRISATFPDLRVYNPKGMVEEFSVQIRRELDFSADGMNAERLKRNMHDLPCVLIPRIYWEFTGPRLLTMEYMEGVRIDDVDAIKAMGLDPGEIADIGFDAYIKQIFVDGFFHGDPHPGNLLVTERGEVVFLDFGIIGVLRPEKKRIFIDLLLALVNSDVDGVLKGLEKLEVNVRPEDVESVKDDLYLALLDWQTTKLEEVHFGTALEGVADTLRRYHIEVPATLMLMLKVISMVMDIGTKLEPSFRFDVKIRPYLTGLVAQSQYSLQNVADAARSARNSAENLLALPQYVNRALRMISDGTISLQLDRSNIMEIERTLDRTVDKILVGVMVAAIVVGSSLILRLTNVQVPQYILTLAALGYVIAVIVGIYAIVSAIFHGSRL